MPSNYFQKTPIPWLPTPIRMFIQTLFVIIYAIIILVPLIILKIVGQIKLKNSQKHSTQTGAAHYISATAMSCSCLRSSLCVLGIIDNKLELEMCDWIHKIYVFMMLPIFRRSTQMDRSGIKTHLYVRKFESDALLQEICDENENSYKNVVMLGAGLDTSFHQFQEKLPENLNLYEVDSHFCQNYKLEVIANSKKKSKLDWSDKIKYCSVDFESEDFLQKLKESCNFNPTERTLYLWSGVSVASDPLFRGSDQVRSEASDLI